MARHQLDYPMSYGLSGPEDSVWAGRYRCEWGRIVGGRVRQWRQQAGLTLTDLGPMALRADGGQYSASFFSRLERGWASPPLFVYISLAEAFGAQPGRLLGLDEAVSQVSEAELTVIKLIRRLELQPEEAILRLTRSASATAHHASG